MVKLVQNKNLRWRVAPTARRHEAARKRASPIVWSASLLTKAIQAKRGEPFSIVRKTLPPLLTPLCPEVAPSLALLRDGNDLQSMLLTRPSSFTPTLVAVPGSSLRRRLRELGMGSSLALSLIGTVWIYLDADC
jgi:hypothetical protein